MRDIKELDDLLSEEQKKRAKEDYEKFYLNKYAKWGDIDCSPQIDEEDERKYLWEVDLSDLE